MASGRLNRPEAPDESVLQRASESVTRRFHPAQSGAVAWQVGRRMDGPRSSVFPLVADLGGNQVSAFYKVSHPPEGDAERGGIWEGEQRMALEVGPGLEACVEQNAAETGLAVASTLASDPQRLIHITLAVQGDPIGRVAKQSLTARRRRKILDTVNKAGVAAATIESCSPDEVQIPDRLQGRTLIERRADRVRESFSSEEHERLVAAMADMEVAANAEPDSAVLVHGDFNTKNVIRTEDGIGLIDFSWLPRMRYTDVAHFAVRLEYEPGVSRRWASELSGALVDGYGVPDLTNRAGWAFLRLSKLLRIVMLGQGRASLRRRQVSARARAEIIELVGKFA